MSQTFLKHAKSNQIRIKFVFLFVLSFQLSEDTFTKSQDAIHISDALKGAFPLHQL